VKFCSADLWGQNRIAGVGNAVGPIKVRRLG
jgi:hypothetical protein